MGKRRHEFVLTFQVWISDGKKNKVIEVDGVNSSIMCVGEKTFFVVGDEAGHEVLTVPELNWVCAQVVAKRRIDEPRLVPMEAPP